MLKFFKNYIVFKLSIYSCVNFGRLYLSTGNRIGVFPVSYAQICGHSVFHTISHYPFNVRGSSVMFPFSFIFKKYLFIFVLGLHCWVFVAVFGAFSSCREQGLLLVEVCGLLTAVAFIVAEQGL